MHTHALDSWINLHKILMIVIAVVIVAVVAVLLSVATSGATGHGTPTRLAPAGFLNTKTLSKYLERKLEAANPGSKDPVTVVSTGVPGQFVANYEIIEGGSPGVVMSTGSAQVLVAPNGKSYVIESSSGN